MFPTLYMIRSSENKHAMLIFFLNFHEKENQSKHIGLAV